MNASSTYREEKRLHNRLQGMTCHQGRLNLKTLVLTISARRPMLKQWTETIIFPNC